MIFMTCENFVPSLGLPTIAVITTLETDPGLSAAWEVCLSSMLKGDES
ncbi:hypothetical protein CP97_14850 [Aurantiacibacter atlanticus]|uniref:Uncharacterized protein n=1 Tax=Aurantiacibacter atlanticus TaxID=1648404 RepID=A0A168M3G6_9SPHN|nr:hypothetical protein CP97_14850 [Aurantiacibacter atlanticus]